MQTLTSFDLKQDIATLLLDLLTKQKISTNRASEIARVVIQSVPDVLSYRYTQNDLQKLSQNFPELEEIIKKYQQN